MTAAAIPVAQPQAVIYSYLLFIWIAFWKGIALWHAARNNQKSWFIALTALSIFTYGIVEILYLLYFSKPKFSFRNLLYSRKKTSEL